MDSEKKPGARLRTQRNKMIGLEELVKQNLVATTSLPSRSIEASPRIETWKPNKDLNILLLGETGVGKSTLINAFANYTSFSNMDEANSSDINVLIPAAFLVTGPDYVEREIKLGKCKDENTEGGQSSTKACKCYEFPHGAHKVTLIDTPGIGDTKGIKNDEENFKKILVFISGFKTIHGICILLKPNESKLSIVFRYCVQGILSQLHKSAVRNIVFVFTNTRSTFYRPGDSLKPLRILLERIKTGPPHVDFVLDKKTIYCFDNEAFRFLVAYKQGIPYNDQDKASFSISWDRSVAEVNRLLEYVSQVPPHAVQETLSVNNSRRMIIDMAKPLCEITKNISDNVILLEDQKKLIVVAGEDITKLNACLKIPAIDLEYVDTDMPRTVCTSPGCIEYVKFEGVAKRNFKKICHGPCFLKGIEPKIRKNPAIRWCYAIVRESGECRVCGCQWDMHMHIKYDVKKVEKTVNDQNKQAQLNNKKELKKRIEETVLTIESRKDKYLEEHKTITEACAIFALFLNRNAMVRYNDAIEDYLEYMIQTEQDLSMRYSGRNSVIDDLKNSQKIYLEQKKLLDDQLKNHIFQGNSAKISPQDISDTINKLKRLEIYGNTVKGIFKVLENYQKNEHQRWSKPITQPLSI